MWGTGWTCLQKGRHDTASGGQIAYNKCRRRLPTKAPVLPLEWHCGNGVKDALQYQCGGNSAFEDVGLAVRAGFVTIQAMDGAENEEKT